MAFPWDFIAAYNPTAYVRDGRVHLLYRAEGVAVPFEPPTSQIGWMHSTDGHTFTPAHPEPILALDPPYVRGAGIEDPRAVWTGEELLVTVNVYDGRVARAALSRGPDPLHLSRPTSLFSDDEWFPPPERPDLPRGWLKSAVLIPEPLDGRWWALIGDTAIRAAHSSDLTHWTLVRRPVLEPQPGTFFSELVEPGPPPIVTEHGIQVIFNGAHRRGGRLRYAAGEALLSAVDPTQALRCSTHPILEPDGLMAPGGKPPDIVFATGQVVFQDVNFLYFGINDKTFGIVSGPAPPYAR